MNKYTTDASALTRPDSTRPDSQVIGPVCVDVNVDAEGAVSRVVGGAVICAAAAAAALGHRVEAVASVADRDQGLLSHFPDAVERVVPVPSMRTSSIRNVYTTSDRERRTSSALSRADPIDPTDIPASAAPVQHLAGLMVGDYAPGIVEELSSRGDLAVDMQGFLREPDPDSGLLDLRRFNAGREFYRRIRFLKVDTAEGEHLTGCTDRYEMARALRDRGAREVMVSNAREILVVDDEGAHVCPLRPRSLAGRTGRGDTVFSAYITERVRRGVDQALLTACATVSLKMETAGPLVCERTDIDNYLARFYADLLDTREGGNHGQ